MSNHVYKVIEVAGSSPQSIEDAIQNAITMANKSLRNLDWFQVVETRGQISDGKVAHYQVVMKIGFRIDA